MEKPTYHHDCSKCIYLETFHGHDLYICATDDPQTVSVICRFGNKGEEYSSRTLPETYAGPIEFILKAPPSYNRALELAAQKGIYIGMYAAYFAKDRTALFTKKFDTVAEADAYRAGLNDTQRSPLFPVPLYEKKDGKVLVYSVEDETIHAFNDYRDEVTNRKKAEARVVELEKELLKTKDEMVLLEAEISCYKSPTACL